jgi:hypothetical protein
MTVIFQAGETRVKTVTSSMLVVRNVTSLSNWAPNSNTALI